MTATAMAITACSSTDILNTSSTYTEGYVLDQAALDSVPVGSSRDQVLLALGSPSLTAIYDNEVFYYMSQTRYRGAQFMKPKIIDRKILAIYFNKDGQIEKISNYGLQDGKLFDTISQTTPTGGRDQSFLSQLIEGSAGTPNLPTIGR
ncbi:outer membrane protein assembly factor BamE [Bartonella tamiae]